MNRTARVVLSVFVSVAIILSLAIVDHRVFAFENNNSNESTQNVNENGITPFPKGETQKRAKTKRTTLTTRARKMRVRRRTSPTIPTPRGKVPTQRNWKTAAPTIRPTKSRATIRRIARTRRAAKREARAAPQATTTQRRVATRLDSRPFLAKR